MVVEVGLASFACWLGVVFWLAPCLLLEHSNSEFHRGRYGVPLIWDANGIGTPMYLDTNELEHFQSNTRLRDVMADVWTRFLILAF